MILVIATKQTPTWQSTRKERKCSVCKGVGHDKRICPSKSLIEVENLPNSTTASTRTPQESAHAWSRSNQWAQVASTVNIEDVVYLVFDLETTGFSRNKHKIIKILALILNSEGFGLEDADFDSFVWPTTHIPPIISTLTGIDDSMVEDARQISEVGRDFHKFVEQYGQHVSHVVLIAHNGIWFDVPFLLSSI